MADRRRVLIAGESWTIHSIHQKGFRCARAFSLRLRDPERHRFAAKAVGTVVARVGADPLIVAGTFGKGRSVAFASDCGPHWAPPDFVEWRGYAPLWRQIVGWASGD